MSFVAVGCVFALFRPAMPSGNLFAAVPPLAWFGGMAMAFYAISATFVTPNFGVGNFVMCVVIAQLVMSTLIDQFGLFGAPVHAVDDEAVDGVADMLLKLYRCFTEGDCDLAEINPLILRPDGGVHALDAKVSLDNNAGFRHPEWEEFRATEELDEREQLARTHDLQYIGLDGTVGIIANGAGLAMSTLDVVNQVGGTAANFLDIGGGANADMMAAALGVINFDENVKSIFINIFGGITRGEEVAKGIVEAMGRVELRAPIVIRLDGTNAEEGRAILANAGIPESKLISKPTMLEAARAAVAIANGTN
jgi:succinyl-CoA synthetase beta subunit